MVNPPPMVRNIEDAIDRMGLGKKTSSGFSVSATSTMVPTDFIDPEVCAKFGIETMADLLEFMESVEEEEDDEEAIVYQLTPAEYKRKLQEASNPLIGELASNQRRGQFWCNKDITYVHIEDCLGCTPFFNGYNKITCVITCSYKFTM